MSLALGIVAVAVALTSLEGWGLVAAWVARRVTGEQPAFDSPGVRGAVGVAALSFVAGFGALARVPLLVPFIAFVVLGCGGWLLMLGERRPSRPSLGTTVRLTILVLLGLWLLVWALADPTYATNDDDIAYLPFAHELLHLGGMAEPFSQRRIGTFGTWIPMEFWGYIPLGARGATLAEAVICPLLVGAALLWSSRSWSAVAIGTAGAVVIGLGATGRINLGPASITVLTIVAAGMVVARRLSRPGGNPLPDLIVVAVLGAQLVGFRLHYGAVALALVLCIAFGVSARDRFRPVAVAAGSAIVFLLPWSLALWRDMGTPLFPILGRGTLNPDWQGYRDPLGHHFGTQLDRVLGLLGYTDTWIAIFAIMAVAVILALEQRAAIVVLAVIAAVALTILVYPVALTASPVDDSWRLTRPLLLGALLLIAAEAGRLLGGRPASKPPAIRLPMLLSVAGMAALVLWLGQVDWSSEFARARGMRQGLTAAAHFDRDPYSAVRPQYSALRSDLSSRSVVAYAVDDAVLMTGAGKTAYNLDVIGANSPAPGMPFFRGADAKVRYLRSKGITDLVTADPRTARYMYTLGAWRFNLAAGNRLYMLWAPYYLDWFKDLGEIVATHPTRSFGKLRLTSLRAGDRT